jgi:hypothetical protein
MVVRIAHRDDRVIMSSPVMATGGTGFRLGIDYGSSNTVAVVEAPDGRLRTLLFDGQPLLPSAVYADQDGRLLVGRDADRGSRLDPARYEPNPKRRIDDVDVLLGDTAHPVPMLIGAVLRRVVDEAVRVCGRPMDTTTLTYPMSWGERRRAHLLAAAAAAGLGSLTLVPEPVAAASYFVAHLTRAHLPPVGPLVVYDLGGGTFDVTVVRAHGARSEVLASDGIAGLGGVDLDALVVAQIAEAVAARFPEPWRRLTNPMTADDHRASIFLWQEARAAKETLSRHPTATVMVPLVDQQIHVSREAFERAAGPLLTATTQLTAQTIARAGFTPSQVAAVFLVGGATRTPAVASALHRALGIAPTLLEQPETVVAEGSLTRVVTAPATVAGSATIAQPAPIMPVVPRSVAPMPIVDTPAGIRPRFQPATRAFMSVVAVGALAVAAWLSVVAVADADNDPGPRSAPTAGAATAGATGAAATGADATGAGATGAGVASTPATVTGTPCPDQAQTDAGTSLRQVRLFETAKSKVYICAEVSGQLWYHGFRRSDGATITLPAHRDGADYVAWHEPGSGQVRVEYRVNSTRLTRSTPTKVEVDEAVTRTE